MRPLRLRSYLLLLILGSAVPATALLAAAAWLSGLTLSGAGEDAMLWLGVALAATLATMLVACSVVARRIGAEIAVLGALAKTLTRGEQAAIAEPLRVRELAAAGRALVEAANIARSRERALRDAERVRDEFFATLGHELRNPLTAMAAAGRILRLTAGSEEAPRQATDTIVRQVEQMARLIEDLLDLSRVTRGKLSLNRQAVDLAAVVQKTVRELRVAGRLEHHRLRLELSSAWARADEARFAQIVTNLLVNAVKYTPAGGEITLSVAREGAAAILRVRDTGIGMSLDFAARVFDAFVQAEQAIERSAGGLGIGLTLVKHLAQLHGGTAFAASSGEGQGSLFGVSLPAIDAPIEQPPVAAPAALERRAHRIVVVEDDDDSRRCLASALQLDGHQVYEAADGLGGIRTVVNVHPDVALIDIGLPGLDGYQVAETLRESGQRESMVLIALTGRAQPDALRRARDAGFDEYVTKPIAPDRLVRLMDVALAAKARRAGSLSRPV